MKGDAHYLLSLSVARRYRQDKILKFVQSERAFYFSISPTLLLNLCLFSKRNSVQWLLYLCLLRETLYDGTNSESIMLILIMMDVYIEICMLILYLYKALNVNTNII